MADPRGGPERAGAPRDYLALALDLDDLAAARRLARALTAHFRVAKVGLELYSAAGPEAVASMTEMGYDVFCDLKLHDIPTTVRRASRVVAELGAAYLTAHAAGGLDMLRACAEGLAEGSAAAGAVGSTGAGAAGAVGLTGAGAAGAVGLTGAGAAGASGAVRLPGDRGGRGAFAGEARVLAVTVLTSERDAPESLLARRIRLAAAAGCGGIVCAAPDLAAARSAGPGLIRVVPGLRLPGDAADDQRRVATPAAARAGGADLLVVGRSVTRASDPLAAAERLHDHLRGQPGG